MQLAPPAQDPRRIGMRRAGAGNAREDRGSVGCRDAASGLYLDWASHVMSLHHSLHCYLHVALRADIANYLSFWETVSMSCLGCRLGSSNGRREQPRSSPPAEAACACACACNCARICRACACACARVPSLGYCLRCPHVLGPGGWEATRPPNHQRPPMRVIRHTVSRPLLLDPFDPSTSTTTKHMDTCARQTARQHGRLFVQRGSRLATRSETWRRDDAHSAVTTNSSIRWHEETGYHPSLSVPTSITSKRRRWLQPRTRPP